MAEQNNELVVKNHEAHLIGYALFPEVNATTYQHHNHTHGHGHGRGRGRDRGRSGRFGNRGSYSKKSILPLEVGEK